MLLTGNMLLQYRLTVLSCFNSHSHELPLYKFDSGFVLHHLLSNREFINNPSWGFIHSNNYINSTVGTDTLCYKKGMTTKQWLH